MKPYYQKNGITVYNEDSSRLASLGFIDRNSIDLVVTSPPYNVGLEYEKGNDNDKYRELLKHVIGDLKLVCKDSGRIVWNVTTGYKDRDLEDEYKSMPFI